MLKPNVVHDGRTTHIPHVKHSAEIQSLALYDPTGATSSASSVARAVSDTSDENNVNVNGGGGGGDDDDEVRLASVDASGRATVTTLGRNWMSDADMLSYASASSSSSSSQQYTLEPCAPGGTASSMSGWAGVCFNHAAPESVAVARHFAKTLDVFDGDRRVRTMNTLLNPYSVAFVPTGGIGGGGAGRRGGEGVGNPGNGNGGVGGMIAIAEGNQLSLWDVRQSERGGCFKRITLANRGQPMYTLTTGISQGAGGGGGIQVSKMSVGEPLIAAAGAERGVHVMDANRWSVIKRWPTAIKFEITLMEMSVASPDHCFLAGLDYELICGCWSRQSIAGGFAFRGDSRWLGLSRAEGAFGGGGGGGGGGRGDIVAGWCESGNLFAARVERRRVSEEEA